MLHKTVLCRQLAVIERIVHSMMASPTCTVDKEGQNFGCFFFFVCSFVILCNSMFTNVADPLQPAYKLYKV